MAKTVTNQFTVAQLKRALTIKERIEQLENELAGILGGSEVATADKVVRRRKMSAAGRARIAAAAKARWARVRAMKAGKKA